jgi:hypothetical protein
MKPDDLAITPKSISPSFRLLPLLSFLVQMRNLNGRAFSRGSLGSFQLRSGYFFTVCNNAHHIIQARQGVHRAQDPTRAAETQASQSVVFALHPSASVKISVASFMVRAWSSDDICLEEKHGSLDAGCFAQARSWPIVEMTRLWMVSSTGGCSTLASG